MTDPIGQIVFHGLRAVKTNFRCFTRAQIKGVLCFLKVKPICGRGTLRYLLTNYFQILWRHAEHPGGAQFCRSSVYIRNILYKIYSI